MLDDALHEFPAMTRSHGPSSSLGQPAEAGSGLGVPAPVAALGYRGIGLLPPGPVVKLLAVRAGGHPAGS